MQLVINSFGASLRKQGDRFVVQAGDKQLVVSAHKVQSILLSTSAHLYPVQSKPGKTRNVKQRDVIRHEAHALANALLGKRDLPRIIETRELWAEGSPVPDPGGNAGRPGRGHAGRPGGTA